MKLFNRFAFAAMLCMVSIFANAAAGPWVIHDGFKLRGYDGTGLNIAAAGNALKIALATSASNAATTSVNNYASLTNELSTANGYTSGGATISQTWTGTSTVTHALSANVVWTATGTITARFAILYDNTDTNKTIIAHCLLDSTPADVSVTSGNTLTISSGTTFTLAKVLVAPVAGGYAAANDPVYDLFALANGWPMKLPLLAA